MECILKYNVTAGGHYSRVRFVDTVKWFYAKSHCFYQNTNKTGSSDGQVQVFLLINKSSIMLKQKEGVLYCKMFVLRNKTSIANSDPYVIYCNSNKEIELVCNTLIKFVWDSKYYFIGAYLKPQLHVISPPVKYSLPK